MKTVCFYHKDTGMIADKHMVVSDDDAVVLNTPAGHIAIDGHHDHLSKRVDVTTGEVIDYQPPPPSADHEWNADAKRWRLKADIVAKQAARQAALVRITQLEAQTLRPLRDHALGIAGAQDRLAVIEAQIAAERAKL